AQCYTDFTASGKPLQCIEDFVQREVLPLYGNTHTSTSVTGLQMTSFREDARETIARAVNAKISGPRPTDCVLFTGQGTTSAVNKLVSMLDLARLGAHKNPERRPVVFVGPFEHHSNLLPWRESGAKVVIIPEGDDGKVCVATLAKELKQHAHRPLRIGAFSAASNLTGVLSDVDALCMIDMNPAFPTAGGAGVMLSQYVYRDGIFLSGHKFVGGPGATGLLVHREDNFQLARKLAAMSVQDYTGVVDLEASERLGHSYESLRWFAYSEDAVTMVKSGGDGELSQLCGPCAPHRYSQKKRSMRPVDDILENPLTLHRSSMNRGSLHHIQPQFSSDFQDFQDTDVVDGSFSKRAALKTWVKRVITRDRQSSNARGSSLRHSLFG
ncbi:hypothetical protein PybrP1_008787, partial [[Pythium] brassicae (nom. inval.)]